MIHNYENTALKHGQRLSENHSTRQLSQFMKVIKGGRKITKEVFQTK